MLKRIVIGLVVTGAVGAFGAWLFGYFSPDPAVVEVQQLQAKLEDPNLSDDDRRALWRDMREKSEALPEGVRREMREAGRQRFEQRFEARVDELLAMAPVQRNKALDEEIDRMERRRAEFERRQAERPAESNSGGNAGANAGGGPGGPGGGPRVRNTNLTQEQSVERIRGRLDRSTPESRAKRQAYRRMIDQRRKERGLPANPGGGGGGWRGRA